MNERENRHEGQFTNGTYKFRKGQTQFYLQQRISESTKQFINTVKNIYKSHTYLYQIPNFDQVEKIITLLLYPSDRPKNIRLEQNKIVPINQESQNVLVIKEQVQKGDNQVTLPKSKNVYIDEPEKKNKPCFFKKPSEQNGDFIHKNSGMIEIQTGKNKSLWSAFLDSQSPVKDNIMEENRNEIGQTDSIVKLVENGEKKTQNCHKITQQKEQKILDALVQFYIKNKSLKKAQISNVARQIINQPSFKASWRWVNQFIKRYPFLFDMLNSKAKNEKENEEFEFGLWAEENQEDQKGLEFQYLNEQQKIESFKVESKPSQEQNNHKKIESFLRGKVSLLINGQLEKKRVQKQGQKSGNKQEQMKQNSSLNGSSSEEKERKQLKFSD